MTAKGPPAVKFLKAFNLEIFFIVLESFHKFIQKYTCTYSKIYHNISSAGILNKPAQSTELKTRAREICSIG